VNDVDRPPSTRKWSHWLRLGVTVALLAWVAKGTDLAKVGSTFANLRGELWLAALGTYLAAQVLSAWRWQMLARPFGFNCSVRQLTAYYFIGMFFNLVLPTSVGGDVVRAWRLDGGQGKRLAAFAAVFLDRFSGLCVLLLLGCVGLALYDGPLPSWITWFVVGSAFSAAPAIVLAPWLAALGQRFARPLEKLRVGLRTLRSPKLLLGSTLLSLGVQAANVFLVMLIGWALGADIPVGYYWIMVPMVTLLSMLPASINGMGVRENATALFLVPLGVPESTAVALALAWFGVFLAASLLGGLVFLCERYVSPAALPNLAAEGGGEHGSLGGSADQGRTGQHRAAA
jgi:uncharacterized membrane protein YbhN (UPF0104 family)